MNAIELPPGTRPFFDDEGRVAQWPVKRKLQLLILEHLARLFEPGTRYHEREVNELLKAATTFGDWALLRRELVDGRHLARTSDGSAYWRLDDQAPEGDAGVDLRKVRENL